MNRAEDRRGEERGAGGLCFCYDLLGDGIDWFVWSLSLPSKFSLING